MIQVPFNLDITIIRWMLTVFFQNTSVLEGVEQIQALLHFKKQKCCFMQEVQSTRLHHCTINGFANHRRTDCRKEVSKREAASLILVLRTQSSDSLKRGKQVCLFDEVQ